MKQVILHVGYPKTGTTSLQRNVFPTVPDGRFLGKFAKTHSQERDLFPDDDIIRLRDALNNQLDLHFQRDKADYIALMRCYLENADTSTVILSLEGLTNPLVDTFYVQHKDLSLKARHIHEVFGEGIADLATCAILMTVRRQRDIVPSYYAQTVTEGMKSGLYGPDYASFVDFLLHDRLLGFGVCFEFDRMARCYQDHFGDDSVVVLPMEAVFHAEPVPQLEPLAKLLGLDLVTLHGQANQSARNVRRAEGGGEKVYRLNQEEKAYMKPMRAANAFVRDTLGVDVKKVGPIRSLSERMNKSTEADLGGQFDQAIVEHFEPSNRRLDKAFGLDLDAFGYFE